MNELFNVEVEENERRKGAFAWFRSRKVASVKALAIGVASIVALSTPVVLFASRNNSPLASSETTVLGGGYVSSTTVGQDVITTISPGSVKKSKNVKLPGLVLPNRGLAPTGTTSTSVAGGESSTTTSIVIPPAPPIVLSPSSTSVATTTPTTIAPGSTSRTISFTTTSIGKTYGDLPFVVSAAVSAGGGEVTYTSSNSAVCTVGSASGEVSIVGTGNCEISSSIPASGMYAPASSLVPVSVTVNKASLVITASSASIAYSPRFYAVIALYAGFVNSENSSVLTTLPTCSVFVPGGFDISSIDRRIFSTSCFGAVAQNYAISYVGGLLSVSNWS